MTQIEEYYMPTQGHEKVYAFIDSQNLNLSTSKSIYKNRKKIYTGWQLDYRKFRVYLKDKFRVELAFIFIGFIEENQDLYDNLKEFGYELIFKPTVPDEEGKAKGNVDAELVLHTAAIEYDRYDKAVVVSGDGDFYCLYNFLIERKKLKRIVIPNSKSESSLLKPFHAYKTFLEHEREKLEYRKRKKKDE